MNYEGHQDLFEVWETLNHLVGYPTMGSSTGSTRNMRQQDQECHTSSQTGGSADYNRQHSSQGWSGTSSPTNGNASYSDPYSSLSWDTTINPQIGVFPAYDYFGYTSSSSVTNPLRAGGHAGYDVPYTRQNFGTTSSQTGGYASNNAAHCSQSWETLAGPSQQQQTSSTPSYQQGSNYNKQPSTANQAHKSTAPGSECNKDILGQIFELCADYAKSCLHEGKFEQARKYIGMAKQIRPHVKIEDLMEQMMPNERPKNSNRGNEDISEHDATDFEDWSKNEAVRFVELAEHCVQGNKFENAKEYLQRAQSLVAMAKKNGSNLFNNLFRDDSYNSATFEEVDANTNIRILRIEQAKRCMKVAKDLMRVGNFDGAQKCLKVARALLDKCGGMQHSDDSTQKSKQNTENRQQYFTKKYSAYPNKEYMKKMSELFVKLAEDCIIDKNYSQARSYLDRASWCQSSERVEELLRKVSSLLAGGTNSNTPETEKRHPYGGVNAVANEEQAERCRELAEYYILEKKFDDAKKYIEKAQRLHSNKKNEELLEKILSMSEKSTNSNTPPSDTRNPYSGLGEVANKDQAEQCRKLAEKCIRERKFDDGKKYLEKAQRLYPTKEAEELLKKIILMTRGNTSQSTGKSEEWNPYQGVGEAANKIQAEECRRLANLCLTAKNYSDAEKYLIKAQKLYPTETTGHLLRLVTYLLSNRKPNAPKNAARKTAYKGPRVQPTVAYTKEQSACVKKILRYKSPYTILGVTPRSTVNEIRQAYKKLALRLHPDKNKAPGAAEAFKAIKKAVSLLTNDK